MSAHLSPQQKWNRANPAAIRAHQIVFRAVHAGEIERRPCEVCGGPAEAHHDDYDHPLDVRWHCRLHHRRLHVRGDIADLFPAVLP